MERHDPSGVAGPFAAYSHAVEVGPGRLLFGAGQVGVDPEGAIGDGIEAQARFVWRNIQAVLASAGMWIENIVQLNVFRV